MQWGHLIFDHTENRPPFWQTGAKAAISPQSFSSFSILFPHFPKTTQHFFIAFSQEDIITGITVEKGVGLSQLTSFVYKISPEQKGQLIFHPFRSSTSTGFTFSTNPPQE